MEIEIKNLKKSYYEQIVLENINFKFKSGNIYAVMGDSGRGKTTLLRLILGLEQPDSGEIIMPDNHRASVVFQEDRLCEHLNAVENIEVTSPQALSQDIKNSFYELEFNSDDLLKPVSQFSGGMKRRVAVVRAIMHSSNYIVMDEPFSGLDVDVKNKTIDYILKNRCGRTLIIVTHDREDALKLNAEIINL